MIPVLSLAKKIYIFWNDKFLRLKSANLIIKIFTTFVHQITPKIITVLYLFL